MTEKKAAKREQVLALKKALLVFLGASRAGHYEDLTRDEQTIETLAQALYARSDIYLAILPEASSAPDPDAHRTRLASRLADTAARLAEGGRVDPETAESFGGVLDLFDVAADLHRQADGVRDRGETAAILHKRGKG